MKKIIYRMCRGCRSPKNRDEMIKITLSNGKIFIKPSSKTYGRSVYVCKNIQCIKNLIKAKGICRGLKYTDGVKIKAVEESLLKIAAGAPLML